MVRLETSSVCYINHHSNCCYLYQVEIDLCFE